MAFSDACTSGVALTFLGETVGDRLGDCIAGDFDAACLGDTVGDLLGDCLGDCFCNVDDLCGELGCYGLSVFSIFATKIGFNLLFKTVMSLN